MIFQDPMSALNPVYSIGRQISENLRQHERLSQNKRAHASWKCSKTLVSRFRSRDMTNIPISFPASAPARHDRYSFAICNPGILIADEPTTALDVTIQAQILELMKRVQQEHGTP